MDYSRSGASSNIPGLTWKIWFCYGVGHVLNDICASLWFTYLLVFFHLVLKFDTINSGLLLLIGQIADGISTSFVGVECDRSNGKVCIKYGKRKTWHFLGTICILGSFPFIFTPCIGCSGAHIPAQMVYYSAFVIIFQFGWAAVQISHLALIPEITPDDHQRTQLTSVRYGFTVASTILIYLLTWISLKSGENDSGIQALGPGSAINFQRVVYIGLVIGSLTSLVFHWGVKEHSDKGMGREKVHNKTVFQYLRDLKFYQIAVVYMSSRLFVNVAQVYIPFYLHETTSNKTENMAVVPLLMYSGSIIASAIVNQLNKIFGRKIAYISGSVIGLLACTWIEFGDRSPTFEIYPISLLLGIGGSILLVTALGLTADLIGFDTETGAFVYGAMSFSDKVSNGLVVMAIQYANRSSCPNFYRRVLVFVCGGSALLGMLTVFGVKRSNRSRKMEGEETEERKPLMSSA